MSAQNSSRFVIQMLINVFICNYAQKKIVKITSKRQGKKAFKSYMIFLMFAIMLIGINQGVYFMFKQHNLYEQLNIPRSYSANQIEEHVQNLKIKIMSMQSMPMNERIKNINNMKAMADVLTHPARRLSYDTFGQTDVEYAWAFTNHIFLLSAIIGSSIFYIICTFLTLIGEKKGEIHEAFKMEILVMILLFLWEIQLIMKTESRYHHHTDYLDSVYTAFPIHERRQMLKIILLPCMNIIKFFFRFFVESPSQKKFFRIAKNQKLRQITMKISGTVNSDITAIDEHLEDRVEVILSEVKKSYPLHTDIFSIQRKIIQGLLLTEGENIVYDDQIGRLLRYFMIK